MKRGLRWGAGLCGALLVAACLPLVPTAGQAEPERPALRILGTYAVPGRGSTVMDVRWSGDDSVMVVRRYGGVRELKLGENEKPILGRQPIPEPKAMKGVEGLARLAVSPGFVVAANYAPEIVWRPFETQKDGSFKLEVREVGGTEDIDLDGDRLVLLGSPFPKIEDNRANIAWLGTLGSGLRDWKPLLRDAREGPDLVIHRCWTQSIGAARFLPDGTIVVVPGSQPGIHLFSREGRPLRTWKSREVGLNTDCREMSREQADRIGNDPTARVNWLNQHRVLDDILPFPQGPGLLIRSLGSDGKVHWELKILEKARISTYQVPLTGEPFERLQGDVRNGRIVLLVGSGRTFTRDPIDHSGRLIVAELPALFEKGGES